MVIRNSWSLVFVGALTGLLLTGCGHSEDEWKKPNLPVVVVEAVKPTIRYVIVDGDGGRYLHELEETHPGTSLILMRSPMDSFSPDSLDTRNRATDSPLPS